MGRFLEGLTLFIGILIMGFLSLVSALLAIWLGPYTFVSAGVFMIAAIYLSYRTCKV